MLQPGALASAVCRLRAVSVPLQTQGTSAPHPPAARCPLPSPPLPLSRLATAGQGLRICRPSLEAGDADPRTRAPRAPRLSPAHSSEGRAAFPPSLPVLRAASP